MSSKTNIGNPFIIKQLLEFEVAFPEEKQLTVKQYLSGISREVILNTATYFLCFNNYNSKFDDNRVFLKIFFSIENKNFANIVYDKIEELEKGNTRIGIINAYSSLRLFEYIFSKPDEPTTLSKVDVEVNLFKAYLVLNSEFTKKQYLAFESAQKSPEELKIPMIMFCMHYPISDKSDYDLKKVYVTQMIKAIYLFKFLESEEKTQPLLAAFLKHFNCTTWEDYLRNFLPLTVPAIKNKNHTDIIVESSEDFEQICDFIEKQIIQDKNDNDPVDFINVRANPFYKVKKGVYRIIFDLFVVEKIFKGVYFLLRDINKTLSSTFQIKEFKSFFGHEFSEKILCYKVMESIYSDMCIRFSGKELADKKIDAAPDYYVRMNKNILLIESKDFLITADKKMLFDFSVYEEEFGKILDYEELPDGKIKPKAVVQLVKNISKILKKEFIADTDYNYREVFIYPVLLTHDIQYDTPGFNELIDFWFQDELLMLKEKGLFIQHVKPLSVVNIDTLIYHQDGFSNDFHLHKMLNDYHNYKKKEIKKIHTITSQTQYNRLLDEVKQKQMSKFIPFSIFLDNYFHSQHYSPKKPQMLNLIFSTLFKEESEVKS